MLLFSICAKMKGKNPYTGVSLVENLSKDTFEQRVLAEQDTCLVLFGKETCPICQEVHPLLEEIEEGYSDRPFHFYYVDAASEDELFHALKLHGVPSTLFFRAGQEVQRFSGSREYEEFEFFIDRVIEGR